MKRSKTLLSLLAVVSSALTTSVTAEGYKFEQSHVDACVLEGAAEWKATFDEPTPAEQEIMNLERLGCQLLAARNIEGLIDAIVADKGIILLDGAGIADGKEAQRALFYEFIDAGYDLVWEAVDARVSEANDIAYAIGVVKVTSPDGTIQHAKYTSIWENIDGTWLNVIEMRNGNGNLGPNLVR